MKAPLETFRNAACKEPQVSSFFSPRAFLSPKKLFAAFKFGVYLRFLIDALIMPDGRNIGNVLHSSAAESLWLGDQEEVFSMAGKCSTYVPLRACC